MIKKLAALLLVLLLALGATSAVAEGESHLQRVLDSGVLRVAMIPENPGWSVMDAEGNWVGYDVEVAKLLAQELGVELELIPTEGGNRVTMVQTDKCDVVISSFTPTLDRAKVITFSNPYGAAGTLPLCRKDNVFTPGRAQRQEDRLCPRFNQRHSGHQRVPGCRGPALRLHRRRLYRCQDRQGRRTV